MVPSFMTRANGRGDVPHSEWMLAFQEELNNFKGDLAVKGLTHKFIGAKVGPGSTAVKLEL